MIRDLWVEAICGFPACLIGGGAYRALLVVFSQLASRPTVWDTHGNLEREVNKAAYRGGVFALMGAIEEEWNAGDVKSYARLYALNAAYVTRAGILWKGREAIERGHAKAFRGDLKGTVLKIRIKRLRFLTPEKAVAHCAVALSQAARQRAGKMYAITRFELRKNRARWEIVAARTREISVRRK